MAETLVVVCEARADFLTASKLADRVFCESIDWMEAEILDHSRRYEGLTHDQPFLTWTDGRKSLSKDAGDPPERIHRRRGSSRNRRISTRDRRKEPSDLIESRWPEVGGILLIRDDDRKTERRAGMEQAAWRVLAFGPYRDRSRPHQARVLGPRGIRARR